MYNAGQAISQIETLLSDNSLSDMQKRKAKQLTDLALTILRDISRKQSLERSEFYATQRR